MSWVQEKIGNLCTVGRGSSPRPIADQKYFDGGTIPWVKIADATASTRYIYKTKQYVNDHGASFSRKLSPGSIILAASGTLGFPMYLGVEACIHDGWLYFDEFNSKKIDKAFFFYKLETLRPYFEQLSYGAAIQNVNTGILRNTVIELPSLENQRKIASIICAYDDLIENNSKRIVLLEKIAQITYEEWFVRLRFPGYESMPVNPETGLPVGWETKAISTICDVNKNSITSRSAPETIRYIDISSAETGYYTTPQEIPFSEAPSRARRRVAFGDTIFSTVRPNRRIFSLVLENDPLLVASTGFAVLTPHRAQNFPFIYLTIAQQSFTDAAVAVAGGAAYPAVNQTDFERIKITIPTQEMMNKFSDAFVPNFTIKGQLQRENALLRQARDILLPRLMTGVIDVESYDPTQLLKDTA